MGSFVRKLTMLFQVSERDPWTLASAAAFLTCVGLLASVVLAVRAALAIKPRTRTTY
jgi:hypothetical protein